VITIEVERRAWIFGSIAWMEACAGCILAKNQRRCQADLSLTSTHYQSEAFQLAQCALTSATLFSSLSRKGSNVAQLAVAIADALGGVLQLAVSQTLQRCSAWCFFELVFF